MTTQFIFFSGKGGVGKTSMACTHAVRYADEGQRTLIVTTDPASNLADVFEQEIGHHVTPIAGVPNLWAMEIDSDRATQEYIERAMSPIRAAFPPQIVQVIEEQMSGPCTAEVAAFDRFTDFLDVPAEDGTAFVVVIFDTAPTGHTLRLLELPVDWSKQIDVKVFASVDATAADDVAKQRFGKVIEMMSDPEQSTFAFVMYPEATPILEAWRAAQELDTVGVHPGWVVANMVIPPEQTITPFVQSRRAMQEKYLGEIVNRFGVPVLQIPLLPREVKGLEMLAELGNTVFTEANGCGDHPIDQPIPDRRPV